MGIFTKIFIWPFLCIPRVVLLQHILATVQPKIHLNTKIWNFAFWVDKMSQNRAIFLKIALDKTPGWETTIQQDFSSSLLTQPRTSSVSNASRPTMAITPIQKGSSH